VFRNEFIGQHKIIFKIGFKFPKNFQGGGNHVNQFVPFAGDIFGIKLVNIRSALF
jgi:hypothetical protein